MNHLDLRPLSLGEVLDRTFSLYRRHFPVFMGIAAIPHLLTLALGLLQVLYIQHPVVIGQGDKARTVMLPAHGLAVSAGTALVALVLGIVVYLWSHDQLPGFYAVGVLTAMFNSQSKRLGDFVAGSIVIFEKSVDAARGSWSVSPSSVLSSSLGASRLAIEDISLIDAFLGRRHDLLPDVRRRMAHEILHRVEPKLTLTEADRADIECTLASLVHEYRSTGRLTSPTARA